jgi:hypothetical protein
MPHPMTLPALGLVAMAGAAFGVYLGEDSVAQINPVHFQGPAIHPRDRGAVVSEWEPQAPRTAFAGLYGWEDGRSARTVDCDGCDLGARDRYWDGGASPAPPRQQAEVRIVYAYAEPMPVIEQSAAERGFDVARYAHYPVSAEEAEGWVVYE